MDLSSQLIDIANPFSEGIVADPWGFDDARTPDIDSVHAAAFATCVRLLEKDVHSNGQSSLLIHGTAGSGKTHLIARLVRWVRAKKPQAVICYIPLDGVAPQMLWSHMRERVIEDLLMRPVADGRSGLDCLLEHRLPGLLAASARRPNQSTWEWLVRWNNPTGKAQVRARIGQELFEQVRLDVEVRATLLKLFSDSIDEVVLARDWLISGRLSEEQLHKLGLSATELSDQVREHQACQVVLSLLRLTSRSYPVILCFDQIEQLMHTLQDRTGYARFGQMLTTIRHQSAAGGLFLVSFIRSDQCQILKDAVGQADWARVAENLTSLSPLTWEQASEVAQRRMQAVDPLRALRLNQGDPYWPLGKRCLQEIHHSMRLTCTPREFLWGCKTAFDRVARIGPQPPGTTVVEYLMLKWRQKVQQKGKASGGEGLIHALNGVPWLGQLLGCGYEKVDPKDLQERFPDGNLFLQNKNGGRIAFTSCPRTAHLWRRLDRLADAWKRLPAKLNCRRLVVLCDTPIAELPVGTRTRLQGLCKLAGVLSACPRTEQITGLEALHALFLDANKGDLVYEGQAVSTQDVDVWASRSLVAPAHELGMLRELCDDLGLEVDAAAATPLPLTVAGVAGS